MKVLFIFRGSIPFCCSNGKLLPILRSPWLNMKIFFYQKHYKKCHNVLNRWISSSLTLKTSYFTINCRRAYFCHIKHVEINYAFINLKHLEKYLSQGLVLQSIIKEISCEQEEVQIIYLLLQLWLHTLVHNASVWNVLAWKRTKKYCS